MWFSGIPSKDTIRQTLEAIKLVPPAQQFVRFKKNVFSNDLMSFVRATSTITRRTGRTKNTIAIDGKTLRRSHDKKKHLDALHIVSAWSSKQGISLGQLATEEKSNEITAISELLDAIKMEGAVITIDANHWIQ